MVFNIHYKQVLQNILDKFQFMACSHGQQTRVNDNRREDAREMLAFCRQKTRRKTLWQDMKLVVEQLIVCEQLGVFESGHSFKINNWNFLVFYSDSFCLSFFRTMSPRTKWNGIWLVLMPQTYQLSWIWKSVYKRKAGFRY